MKIYKFDIATVRVIDCSSEIANFTIAEVFNEDGEFVHEIRTTTKGEKAAHLAFHDALRCRLI